MTAPFLSIIVPIYNVSEYLKECLDSIARLEYKYFEVIMVNDGSTDDSSQIAQLYENIDPIRFKLFHRENGGLSAARNTGMEHASGEWISFIDSDDFIDHSALDNVLKKIQNKNIDIVSFDGFRYIEDGKKNLPLYSLSNPFKNGKTVTGLTYLTTILDLKMTNVVTVWDKIYRKSTIDKLNLRFVDGLLHEDIPFTFNLFLNNVTVLNCPEDVIYYRQRIGSIMSTVSPNKTKSEIKIIYFLLELFKAKKINIAALNGFIVFMIKNTLHNGGKLSFRKMLLLFVSELTLKKRMILCFSLVINIKNRLIKRL